MHRLLSGAGHIVCNSQHLQGELASQFHIVVVSWSH
jgi:hypothetical protein